MPRPSFTGAELPLRPQEETECRRCGVHCDKVVYPGACVERACPFLYAYEEWGRTYVGCMQKVFDVEIDLEILRESQGRKGGFGAVKTVRQPLPMCKAEVASCYDNRAGELGCVNPEFYELPRGKPSFRVVAHADDLAQVSLRINARHREPGAPRGKRAEARITRAIEELGAFLGARKLAYASAPSVRAGP